MTFFCNTQLLFFNLNIQIKKCNLFIYNNYVNIINKHYRTKI